MQNWQFCRLHITVSKVSRTLYDASHYMQKTLVPATAWPHLALGMGSNSRRHHQLPRGRRSQHQREEEGEIKRWRKEREKNVLILHYVWYARKKNPSKYIKRAFQVTFSDCKMTICCFTRQQENVEKDVVSICVHVRTQEQKPAF